MPGGPHGAEAVTRALGRREQVDVDLDVEDVLHAPDVAMAELLDRVEERTTLGDTRGGIDDLVAVHPAPAALDLVLGPERQLGDVHACFHPVRFWIPMAAQRNP